MKRIYILPFLLLTVLPAFAQNLDDIVRYGVTHQGGTARSSAMGGAFGALGGDISTLGTNPAGTGVFRRSEVSFTPFINIANTESGGYTARKTSFQPASIGLVVSWGNSNFAWRGVNFGFSYTNLNNFNRRTDQYVYNSPTTWSQVWVNEANWEVANGRDIPYRSEMAYQARLFEWSDEEASYVPNIRPDELTTQHQLLKERGYQGEYNFSFGTNYLDRLYLGFSVGIQVVDYKFTSTYTEMLQEASASELGSYVFGTGLHAEGVGTNFRLGFIYRPVPELRIGAAIHTPTYYSMSEDYTEEMSSFYDTEDEDGNSVYESYLPVSSYDYDMQTPWKAVFSLAAVLGKKAILSADYEFHNYRSAKFNDSENGYDYNQPGGINEGIREGLQSTHNLRLGAEYRVNSVFSLRAGYARWDSPYRNSDAGKVERVSGGFGLNFGYFFFDTAYAYRYARNETRFYQYTDPEDSRWDFAAEPVSNKFGSHELKFTLGARF